jgi:hypothetical protein
LRLFDDSVTEELELVVALPVVLLVPPLLVLLLALPVDPVVELAELRAPPETTPSPTTIIMAITTMATILEEIALAPWAI